MLTIIFLAMRLLETLLIVRILLGYARMPALKPLEGAVHFLTGPYVNFVRSRMQQPAHPESATWVALILIWLLRIALSLVV